MYFAKNEFAQDVEIAERALRDAKEAIRIGARDFGIELDGSASSISGIDEILDQLHRSLPAPEFPKEVAEGFARIFGSYFGEIVRQAYGAVWGLERIYDSRMPALSVGPSGIVFNPLRWARERIVEGTERNLQTYYEVLGRSIRAGEEEDSDDDLPVWSGKAGALSDRLYTLRHDQDYFDTGTTRDGRQVLAHWASKEPMVIFFDSAGNLLGCEMRRFDIDAEYRTPECDALIAEAAQVWKDEIGFQPKPIRVRRFALPEQETAIEDRPDHYEMFLKAPELEEPDEEEREAMYNQIRDWDEEGNFVLYWGNDLWLDADGEVTSS